MRSVCGPTTTKPALLYCAARYAVPQQQLLGRDGTEVLVLLPAATLQRGQGAVCCALAGPTVQQQGQEVHPNENVAPKPPNSMPNSTPQLPAARSTRGTAMPCCNGDGRSYCSCSPPYSLLGGEGWGNAPARQRRSQG
ncbi:hypothetical protein TSOC_000403 [Tetrabaena socialis]|uniref:Uncharacterized protein n=1 Tax=Tetrabaena socialis TaxID=47790 RepID=A0A2J8AJG0_9CHLO|nr:hypothetical protein TSOC_000403 [Tetrabaena socialis]|eukprot:PNH12641.1 hypothetical protein TSOC_000403 [Tetrabaena socialis]